MMRMWIVSFALFCATASSFPPPNFVVLLGDDVGYGDLNCYGHPSSSTPHLDRMASEGLRMLQWYSAAPVCSPSRASLMTGRFPVRAGVYTNASRAADGVFSPLSIGGLPQSEITLAKWLGAHGYATGACGKWHLGVQEYLPVHHGFDEYFGAPMTQNECVSNIHTPGSAHQGGPYGPCPLYHNATLAAQGNVDMLEVDTAYIGFATEFIARHAARAQPFFLYFASHHTHAPQFAGASLINTTRRGLFGDSLAELDRAAGSIMEQLRASHVADNSIFLFSADNGASLHWQQLGGTSGLLRCGKGTTWEGGQRVPTLLWGAPVVKSPGTVVEDVGSLVDVFPTFSALAGVPLPPNVTFDGIDLSASLARDHRHGKPHNVYSELSGRDHFFYWRGNVLMAVRSHTHKLHFYTMGWAGTPEQIPRDALCQQSHALTKHDPPLLYNLQEDASEKYPLNGAQFKSVVADLSRAAQAHLDSMVWAQPQFDRGSSPDRFPCCSPECSPKPECCKCSPLNI